MAGWRSRDEILIDNQEPESGWPSIAFITFISISGVRNTKLSRENARTANPAACCKRVPGFRFIDREKQRSVRVLVTWLDLLPKVRKCYSPLIPTDKLTDIELARREHVADIYVHPPEENVLIRNALSKPSPCIDEVQPGS